MPEIELIRGDITKLDVDAIVNAANSSLLGGGGVDGAIHRAAGPQLLNECRTLNGCSPGKAKITKGYRLAARYVIHTVGPVWYGGNNDEAAILKSCYLSCLDIAESENLKSIAFPNISTGAYGYPKNEAALVAINAVKQWIGSHNQPSRIVFVVFDEENHHIYQEILKDA